MQSVSLLVASCLVLAVSLVQSAPANDDPKPCCFAPAYEAKVSLSFNQQTARGDSSSVADGTLYMDNANTRFAVIEDVFQNGATIRVKAVKPDANSPMWIAIPHQGICFQSPTSNFPACIPDGATFKGSQKVAGVNGGASLDVNQWQINELSPQEASSIRVSVTKDKCAPVFFFASVASPAVNGVYSFVYSDVKAGISDSRVFNLPSFCGANSPSDSSDPKISAILKHFRF